MLRKVIRIIQEKFGLTKSEAGIILFLAFGLVVGGVAKIFDLGKSVEKYDFSDSDSFFSAASSRIDSAVAAEEDTGKMTPASDGIRQIAVTSLVDLNRAGLNDLINVPGIGRVTAQRIIDYRNANGKFMSVKDLLKVKGIGSKKLEQIKHYVSAD